MSSEIVHRTALVQKMFMNIQEFLSTDPSLSQLIQRLEEEGEDYRSIAYESASMGLAYQNLVSQKDLDTWHQFVEMTGKTHAFHIDIGLGWALGKAGTHPTHPQWPEMQAIHSLVMDGMGYYYALYRGRRTLKQGWLPFSLSAKDQQWFDGGVGRRMWYVCQGRMSQLQEMLAIFPDERKAGLWRGLGIASGYVGGTHTSLREEMLTLAGDDRGSFVHGMTLAGISRLLSDTYEEDISQSCQQICQMQREDFQKKLDALPVDWFDQRFHYPIETLLLVAEHDFLFE